MGSKDENERIRKNNKKPNVDIPHLALNTIYLK